MQAMPRILCLLLACLLCAASAAAEIKPLRLAIAGLVHGHVDGFLHALKARDDVQLVGVFDPDLALQQKYAQRYGLPRSLFFTELGAMLDQTKPEAVSSFTSTYDHPSV